MVLVTDANSICDSNNNVSSRVPPNCRFEIDDFEHLWSHSQPFDFIHGRELEGCIRDHDRLFEQALGNLNPNGWLEMATFETCTYSDDETHQGATNMCYAIKNIHESSLVFGKDMTSSPTWKSRMEKAGFVNVKEDIYKVLAIQSHLFNDHSSDSGPVTSKPMAEGSKAQGAGSVSSTEHD